MKPANGAWNEDEATGQRIPKEYMGQQFAAPPLGRWTLEWVRNGFARKQIEQFGLEALRANVRMYERHVADDPSNEVFQDWLKRCRQDLVALEAWMARRDQQIAENDHD